MEYQPKRKNNNKKQNLKETKRSLKNIQENENIIMKEADREAP